LSWHGRLGASLLNISENFFDFNEAGNPGKINISEAVELQKLKLSSGGVM
jgi:hypothetical protein